MTKQNNLHKKMDKKKSQKLGEREKMICYICGEEITNIQILLFRRGHCIVGDYHKKCLEKK